MSKEEIIHKDKLGRILKIGDCVAVPHGNGLMICIIKKLNPKMLKVAEVGRKSEYRGSEYNKYSNDSVLLEGSDVTMFLLKMAT